MAKQVKKATYGGARPGAGRKPKFDEPTGTKAFRLPQSLIEAMNKVENLNQRVTKLLQKEFQPSKKINNEPS